MSPAPTSSLFPYTTLFRSLARGVRDGFVDIVQMPDGKVGFKVGGKTYKGTPSSHVANWDNGFKGVVQSVLDTIPNEYLASDRKSTRLNSSHLGISYAVFCL